VDILNTLVLVKNPRDLEGFYPQNRKNWRRTYCSHDQWDYRNTMWCYMQYCIQDAQTVSYLIQNDGKIVLESVINSFASCLQVFMWGQM